MARLPSFLVGTRVQIEAKFFGRDDLTVNPTSMTCRVKPPNGEPTTAPVSGLIDGVSIADIVLSEEGTWRYIIETPEGAVHSGIILAESHPF